jgi:hypothetical protein
MTGKLPGDKPKTEDSTPSKDSGEEAAPEAATKPPPQRQAGADARLREILADLKQAGLTPSELKTFKREAQREAERKPESRPEPRQEAAPPPQQKGPEPPKKPVYSEYEDWEKYEAAKDKYTEDLADYKVQLAIAKDRQDRAQAESQKTWQTKLAEASERYGAEAETAIVDTARAISGDQDIHPAVKAILDDSSVLTDLLYVMGSNESSMKEFVSLARSNPGQAIRKAVLLERLVLEELAKQKGGGTPERAEDGKFQAAKKISQAPPPPREVNGRAGPPPDETESAVKNNDFRSFREAENRKAIAKLKGL